LPFIRHVYCSHYVLNIVGKIDQVSILFFCVIIYLRIGDFASKAAARIKSLLGANQGIELETAVNIPKGSGLGTSSILMLACIKSLRGIFLESSTLDNEKEKEKEFNAVLAIEQLLTTGGGWQVHILNSSKIITQ
jgi:galactokinase/mevalonate kinase-like predicted kinase